MRGEIARKSPHSRAPDEREGNPRADRAEVGCPVELTYKL